MLSVCVSCCTLCACVPPQFSIISSVIVIGWGVSYIGERTVPLYPAAVAVLLIAAAGLAVYRALDRDGSRAAALRLPSGLLGSTSRAFSGTASARLMSQMKRLLAQVRLPCGWGPEMCSCFAACSHALPCPVLLSPRPPLSWQVRATGSQATIFAGFIFYNIVTFQTGGCSSAVLSACTGSPFAPSPSLPVPFLPLPPPSLPTPSLPVPLCCPR